MSLKTEIKPFIDGNGLVAPNLVTPGTKQASDNGTCFTSEYYVMLQKSGQLIDTGPNCDKQDFASLIGHCIGANGTLNRAPGDSSQEGPDDYYGVMNACLALGNTVIPRTFLKALVVNYGFLNNQNPGQHTGEAFLVRQLQLVSCMVTASFPSWFNPIHVLIRTLCAPLYWFASIVILFGARAKESGDTDSRRLGWHLVNTVKNYSMLCKLASIVWMNRLYSTYPTGMQGVALIYYKGDGTNPHPFAKYWVTK